MVLLARYDCLAAMAGNSSNTVSVATAIEPLVRSAVPSSHVVVLVPDVSVALSPRNVGRMVVPRPDFKLSTRDRFEEHRLRAATTLVDPLLQGALEVASLQVISTSRGAHISISHAIALQSAREATSSAPW